MAGLLYSHQGDMREAYRLIEQMRERRIVINPYLERVRGPLTT